MRAMHSRLRCLLALAAVLSSSSPADAEETELNCHDYDEYALECPHWADEGECGANPGFMHAACALSCGCPVVPMPSSPPAACVDRDKSGACAQWAEAGECEANPSFMKLRCAQSCNTCDMLDYGKRCPSPADRTPAVAPGQMDETFRRALSDFPELEPVALSTDPWVVAFERFLSPDEVAAVLKHGEGRYERSTASGGRKDDEFIPLTSEIRTSWTTWCDNSTCLDDPIMQRITERVADVTRVPSQNFEFLQLLRYLPCESEDSADCQFYRRHHDTIPELASMQPGPRVYTFFLYLSDVDDGGGTKFDSGFTVEPKAGKALFWPATRADDSFVSDGRTHHEALPVLAGTKYTANFWLHQYDYISAHNAGCTT